jgi:TRAP-type C4-dicarboxylate transport system substrate-binding protein
MNAASHPKSLRALLCIIAGLGALAFASPACALPDAPATEPIHLRIVGGLGSVHQYTRNEMPFWTQSVPARTKGRLTAEIVPFDKAGLRGHEVLRLMQAGIVPFGTALLGISSSTDPEWAAPDLAGLSPDLELLKRVMAAYRPYVKQALKDRYGIELLAVYAYPAQVVFCKTRFAKLSDLAGRRIRTATPSQSDYVEGIGAIPVRVPFAELVSHLRSGNTDCAITGTMSGNTIGLSEITTHVHALPVTWGISIFGANSAAWASLPADIRAILQQELARLEADVWAEAEAETSEGLACNAGKPGCTSGKPGTMVVVPATAADKEQQRAVFLNIVLPRWVQRCGPHCVPLWNSYLRPVTGYAAEAKPAR